MANLRANKIVGIGSTDAGTTFDGPISLNTQGYMYFPTGNTTDRGRGRGVIMGGSAPGVLGTIQYVEIQSLGNFVDFGELTVQVSMNSGAASASSNTRGVIAGGIDQPTAQNVIDFITIASEGNATDFGDSTGSYPYRPTGNTCNLTRGVLVAGGASNPYVGNIVEFVTIATTGNAQDFGDLFQTTNDSGGACSDSHGGLE